ncbi:MAG: permease [Candidatus Coatesbacteria bacterium]|nr:permease [Candidatus Coatesbacteria bacterium]
MNVLKKYKFIIMAFIWCLFITLSYIINFTPGKKIAVNFWEYMLSMALILPPVIVVTKLFEVWVKKETVMKHLGEESGIKGYFWVILLSSTIVGGLAVSLPVAVTLHKKGASMPVVLTFIGTSCVCRIPMTIFEATYLGIEFTVIRWLISIPLIILSSIIVSKFMKDYSLIQSND